MKPNYQGWPGAEHWENLPDGTQEMWEWRAKDQLPLFDVAADAGQRVQGLPRKDAAALAGLLFLDPSVSNVSVYPTRKAPEGDWFLHKILGPSAIQEQS